MFHVTLDYNNFPARISKVILNLPVQMKKHCLFPSKFNRYIFQFLRAMKFIKHSSPTIDFQQMNKN